ncbi:hypothetical protein C2E23DRAFT_922741 [Lenzites betulinus]|nr:hypothetical protein C2E23DRAFT_922741 [Lenzites betulinus]
MPPTTILARERSVGPAGDLTYPATAMTVQYEVVIPPRTPLHTGQQVRIYTLRPCNYLFPTDEGEPQTPRFMAEETGVEGRIAMVQARGRGVTEFVVTNENIKSQTTKAIVAVQHTAGAYVKLTMGEHLLLAVTRRKQPTVDSIPMERGAIVMWRNGEGQQKACHECGAKSVEP